jgi:hypothetical protein
LYYQTIEQILLKCLDDEDANLAIGRSARGHMWYPSIGLQDEMDVEKGWILLADDMLEDCFKYYKGCQDCHNFNQKRLSEIWCGSASAGIDYESLQQVVAIQRMGN